MRIVFRGGNVFDGSGSAPAIADIVVADGRILDVGVGLDGDEAVDLAGRGVLPGLFDCHTHVTVSRFDYMSLLQRPFSYQFYEAARNLRRTLDIGITTIRDAHGADLGVKQAVEDGLIPGPRMQISVTALSQTGGHGDGWMPSGNCVELMPSHPGRPSGIADGADDIRRKVRELVRAGADVIKVFTSGGVLSPRDDPRHSHFRLPELQALVEEATAAGIWVMAHAQGADGIKNAVRAGIRSIEHGIFLDDEGIELRSTRAPGWCRRSRRRRRSSTWLTRAGACRRRSSPRRGRSSRSTGRLSGGRSTPASRSRWALTAASARTVTTCARSS